MTGYRVAVESPSDPLAIDVDLCRSQRFQQRLAVQIIATVLTAGLWLPGVLVWLVTASRRTRTWAERYSVRVQDGLLIAGDELESRTVPLDAIADVAVSQGYATASIRGSRPLQMFGLRDPLAAARAILGARDAHVRALRSELREEILEAEAGTGRTHARR